jgi:hypothetical protein
MVFVHHSCGENWLADANGGLGQALAENGYRVSDTNYGWGPDSIGDRTDITDWPEWFTGPRHDIYLQALYAENEQHCEYARSGSDPGGENQIVVFKSCFPNSNLTGKPSDPPARGEGLTVANAKAIYKELLGYFAIRPDKLFIAITAPPVQDSSCAANARAFNKWLVQDWLADYRAGNVAVFDFYNVLTDPNHHHRVRGEKVEYICDRGGVTLYYPSDGDDHPSATGNRKATEEFVPLLNAYYQKWAASRPQAVAVEDAGKNTDSRPAALDRDQTGKAPQQDQATSEGVGENVVADFDGSLTAWQTFQDETPDTRLSMLRDTERKHGGEAAMRIRYKLATDGWATGSLVYNQPEDWSRFRGLSLYVQVEKPGQPLTVIAYGGKSSDDLLHFEYRFAATEAAVNGWQRVEILWPQFQAAAWQSDPATPYDPHSAMGIAFGFSDLEGETASGIVWVDDVTLIR